MDRDTKRRHLLSSALFAALPADAREDLLSHAMERAVRRGQTVLQKGDAGSYMVWVLSGQVRISDTSPEGKEITLNMIDAGEVFGEIALLDGKSRSADAVASEDSHLIQLERRHFLPWLLSNHDLALRLIDLLCERLRNTTLALTNFVMLDLPERLAHKLLELAGEYGKISDGRIRLEIRLSHSDLGRFVGCSRETVNKQMRAWEEKGILARETGRIVLFKPQVLKRIAGQV
jgi:CRP-like cAMP-binding protein